jgi:predicted DNA-binding protein (UPF0251 family)
MSKRIEAIIEEFRKANPLKGVRRGGSWAAHNPEEYEAAKRLYLEGYTCSQISKHLNVSYETVCKQLKRDGLWKQVYCKGKPLTIERDGGGLG